MAVGFGNYVQWLRWLKIHLTLNLCQNSKCKQSGFYLVLLSGNPNFFINCKVIQDKHTGKSYIWICSYRYLLQLKSTSFLESSFLYMLWFLLWMKGMKLEGKERWDAFTRQNFISVIKISFGFKQLIFSGIMFHPKTFIYLEDGTFAAWLEFKATDHSFPLFLEGDCACVRGFFFLKIKVNDI